GPWAVALGPVVLSPWGMAWEAHVTMERGPSASRSPESQAVQQIPSPSAAGARWYRGDLHLHTIHSDGERHPAGLAAVARPRGLDLMCSTEHNPNAQSGVCPGFHTPGVLVIPGEADTPRHGHWLAVG